MNILKKPLNDLKITNDHYYGKCTNPKCQGEYSFKDKETRLSYDKFHNVASCPNCSKEIKLYTFTKFH